VPVEGAKIWRVGETVRKPQPVIKTLPLASKVAKIGPPDWAILTVGVKVPVEGSYSSALIRVGSVSLPSLYPPAIKTLPTEK
jgi:hypothetical protein